LCRPARLEGKGASIPVGLRRGNSERLEGEDVHPSAETGRVQTPVFRAFLCTQVLAWGETPGDRDIGREAPRACRELPAFRAGCRPTRRAGGVGPAARRAGGVGPAARRSWGRWCVV